MNFSVVKGILQAALALLLFGFIVWMVIVQLTTPRVNNHPSASVRPSVPTASPTPSPTPAVVVAANNLCRIVQICTNVTVVYGPFDTLLQGSPATGWFVITDLTSTDGTPFKLGWTMYTDPTTGEYLGAE